MDFALPYTEEQEKFRQEVRTWLTENVPSDLKDPVDSREFTWSSTRGGGKCIRGWQRWGGCIPRSLKNMAGAA